MSISGYSKRLFIKGSPVQCGAVAGLIVNELAPDTYEESTLLKDELEVVYALSGAVMVHDEDADISNVPKGGSCVLSLTKGTTIAYNNPSSSEPCRFIRIELEPWPSRLMAFATGHLSGQGEAGGTLRPVVSVSRRQQSALLHAEVHVYSASLHKGEVVCHSLKKELQPYEFDAGHAAWVFVASGSVELNGESLTEFSSGRVICGPTELVPASLASDGRIELVGRSDDAEVLVIDSSLPPNKPEESLVAWGIYANNETRAVRYAWRNGATE